MTMFYRICTVGWLIKHTSMTGTIEEMENKCDVYF